MFAPQPRGGRQTYKSVIVVVAVIVGVAGPVIVAVHVHGNAPVSVIDLRRSGSNRVTDR